MRVQVTIEEKDINRGTPRCGSECAAIYALHRVFGKDVIDRVTRAYIVFRDGTRKRSPKILREFCETFDRGGKDLARPCVFNVNL